MNNEHNRWKKLLRFLSSPLPIQSTIDKELNTNFIANIANEEINSKSTN